MLRDLTQRKVMEHRLQKRRLEVERVEQVVGFSGYDKG